MWLYHGKTISIYHIGFGGYIETDRYWQKSPYWPLTRYVLVHPCPLHAHIYTGCVGTVCKLITNWCYTVAYPMQHLV